MKKRWVSESSWESAAGRFTTRTLSQASGVDGLFVATAGEHRNEQSREAELGPPYPTGPTSMPS